MPRPSDARDELAASLADLIELATALVEVIRSEGGPPPPGDTLVMLRQIRAASVQAVTSKGVRFELAYTGASWRTVAAVLGLPEELARQRYGEDYAQWVLGEPVPDYAGLSVSAPRSLIPTDPGDRDRWLTRWWRTKVLSGRSGSRRS